MIVAYGTALQCDNSTCRAQLRLALFGEGVRDDPVRQVATTALLTIAQICNWGFVASLAPELPTKHFCPRCQ